MPFAMMNRTTVLAVAIVLAGFVTAADAGVVTYRLGEQDFAHGAGPIFVTAGLAAGSNEAYPFNGAVSGDDRWPAFGRVRFSFHLLTPTIGDGSLTLGLIGLDSPPGARPTVRLFLNGVQQSNDIFAGVSSPNVRSSASVVTVPVSAHILADGDVEVLVKAFRHGPGYPGNAISADFATLTVNAVGMGIDPSTQPGNGTDNPGNGTTNPGNDNGGNNGGGANNPPHAIPLPPAVLPGGVGLILASILRKRV